MHPGEVFRPTLTKLVGVLRRLGIRFHLTGGITAVAYGEPRMTQDLVFVIDAAAAVRNRDTLLAALREAGFYLEESTASVALDPRSRVARATRPTRTIGAHPWPRPVLAAAIFPSAGSRAT